ncbi:hypothetical protein ACSWLD_004670 [Escherichia coli]|uniref:hypothetical protein n=1 Tax=Escherichia coli TaxID=562 RepID=UPI0010AD5AFA|nr:hypothetical protein [Escherichia coli]EEQ7741439.1 hypothetical protein [Escherichia coli]EFH0260054.1 hypothetical protein [Escherichia coli]EFL1001035.1 hypothetical protein [Escherichia coli]EHB3418878.1 hypothetical protein [Escherichia coli]EIH6798488.1 hypothetical protein [Escherichia coli]
MSSKEQYLKVTFESFSNYLTSFKKTYVCPICSNTNWTLLAPEHLKKDDGFEVIGPSIPGKSLPNNPVNQDTYSNDSLNMVAMQCTTCGFFHFFSLNKVSENISSGKFVKGDGDNV